MSALVKQLRLLQAWYLPAGPEPEEAMPSKYRAFKEAADRIVELERDLAAAREWREAVLNELIVAHIYTKEHDTNPRKAIQDAITWNCQVALDPAVSSDAQKLIAAAQEARKRAEERAAACKKDAERWKKYLEIYDSEELAEAAWGGAGEITKTVDAAIDAARTP